MRGEYVIRCSGGSAAHRSFRPCGRGRRVRLWGVFPLYLKPLSGVPALQIMAHRIVWCCLLVFAWLALRGELGAVRAALANPAVAPATHRLRR